MKIDKNIPSPPPTSFEVDISAAVDNSGFTGGLGGPNQGGHQAPNWYIQYGMDIGADEGTQVYAAFDAHITKFTPHNPEQDNGGVYGAQIFMRAPNDMMGGFYTHLTDVPSGISVGTTVSRGDLLGRVHRFGGIPPHLHLALVEIIGGAPGGQYVGVDLYQLFLDLESAEPGTVIPVKFWQDGSAPSIVE
ncbi:M23 family metallopeptidase [Bacillus sp. TE8-1]|uniref:M23 family metallopeptidase n=1 Tax=Bacillus sp. TE8-1 TaxID=2217829 RepID=UPI0011EEDA71|nr:M23 family metallopeptidase [Bacillus sp. TE8-1]KAA0780914.1 M23 family peptidase [Bacillus sp. TE8-1]